MVYQLYQDPDPDHKGTADRWLQGVQGSTQAWTLAWVLLQHQVCVCVCVCVGGGGGGGGTHIIVTCT